MILETFLLFLGIMLFTTFLASGSQKIQSNGSIKFEPSFFFAAFFIHWFFLAFTRSGTDHDQYIEIIKTWAEHRLLQGEEPGFNGLLVVLQSLFDNPEIVLFFVKTITIIFYYHAFWLLRKRVSLFFLMLTFNSGLYIWSFVVLGQSMAVALSLIAASLVVLNKKWYLPVLLALLAFTIHASAIVVAVLLFAVSLFNKYNVKIGRKLLALMLAGVILIVQMIKIIYGWAIAEIGNLAQYSSYADVEGKGSGLFNYAYYLFLFVLLLLPIYRSGMVNRLKNFVILSFMYGLLSSFSGYYIGSTRLNYYTYILYLILIPYYYNCIDIKVINKDKIMPYKVQKFTWFLYLMLISYNELLAASDPKSLSDLYDYSLFNPFI